MKDYVKKIYKIIGIILLSIILAIPISVQAEDTTEEASTENKINGIVQVNYGYSMEDGSFDIWNASPGILINKNTVLTYDSTKLDYTSAINEREIGYNTIGIDIVNEGTSSNSFTIYSGGASLIKVTEVIPCNIGGYDMLVLRTDDEMQGAIKFTPGSANNDKKIYATGFSNDLMDTYHYAKSEEILKQSVRIVSEENGVIDFSIDSQEAFNGGALVNDNNEVYGLILSTDDGGKALKYDVLKSYLDDNNIIFETGQEIVPVSSAELDKELELAKIALATTTDTYTEETEKNLKNTIQEVEKESHKDGLTQKQMDNLAEEVRTARNNLEIVPKKDYLWLIIVIIVVILFLIAFLLMWMFNRDFVYKVLGVQQKKKVQPISVQTTSPSTFIGNEDIIPELSEPHREAKSFDPQTNYVGGYIYNGREDAPKNIDGPVADTGILQNDANSNDNLYDVPYLIRTSTGERIIITGNNFTIGRNYEVNYRIPENISISKEHCRFVNTNGTWYIMDNKSSNKTYVDGKMIEPKKYVALSDMSEIILGNEKFVFRFIHEKEQQYIAGLTNTAEVPDTGVLTTQRNVPNYQSQPVQAPIQQPASYQTPVQAPLQAPLDTVGDMESGTDVLRSTTEREQTVKPKAFLVINKKRIFLDKMPFTIGRSENDSYTLKGDKAISRAHLTITYENNTYYAIDKNSANGTTYNDTEYMDKGREYQLTDGDTLNILGTIIEFHSR